MDLGRVVAARVKAAMGALGMLRPFLQSKTIPMHVRLSALKAMLVPHVTYGGELLGFREALVKPLQSVLNRGLRLVLGLKENSKGCIAAVLYRQCGVAPVFAIMAGMRLRAHLKFPSLRTWASILSRSKSNTKSSWHGANADYLSRVARVEGAATMSHQVHVDALKELLWKRSEERKEVAESPTWKGYQPYMKTSGFIRVLSYKPSVIRGISLLAAARSGAMWTAQKAANARIIDAKWKHKCPCCNKNIPETLEHILLKCKRWHVERRVMSNKIDTALKKNKIKINWHKKDPLARLTLLLGGAADGCDLSPYWLEGFSNHAGGEPSQGRMRYGWRAPLFTYVADFFASIQADRSKAVWVHFLH
jgi:hypothetical protein